MEIVDAQVHAWERDTAEFPWRLDFGRADIDERVQVHFTATTMSPGRLLACMDEAGVDAAVVVSPTLYGSDTGYVRRTVAHDPSRLAFVGLVDPWSPSLDDDLARWRAQPGALAVRVSVYGAEAMASLESGRLRAVLAAAERHDVPVCVYAPGYLSRLVHTAKTFPNLQLVVDHLGLPQPSPAFPTIKGDPFRELSSLLELAAFANVAVKATGLPSLSREAYPFQDVWDPLRRVLDAFGCDRVMWGTDFTRVERARYGESVDYLRELDFSAAELTLLYGGTLRRVLRW
jgi:predicted TIM-barrel fold metal-dependent hydrolase